ncbi:MAG: OPT/YSL family transporter [Candidatus Thorarchaeota archaeon]
MNKRFRAGTTHGNIIRRLPPLLRDHRSTRMTLAGLYGAGLFYVFVVMLEGRWLDPSVILAGIIEAVLLVASLRHQQVSKGDLGLSGLFIIGLVGISLGMGIFTEMTVMGIAGIIIYLGALVEPKFPLTKRAIATGIGVGIVMTFLGIYLALKLGMVYFVGAEMLGALVLGIKGGYTKEENTIVVAIANGSSMISIGVLITFPAIEIFAPDVAASLITYPFIVFVTGTSAIFGLLLLAPFREQFEREPWPQVKPQAECIISMGLDKDAKKDVAEGVTVSAAWVGAAKVLEVSTGNSLSTFPDMIKSVVPSAAAVPNWIGISNSPLIAAIGYFVGWKRTLTLILGSIMTLMIWVFLEGAQPISYSAHLHRPEILYLALGIFATVIAGDFATSRKDDSLTYERFEQMFIERTKNHQDQSLIIDRPHKISEEPRLLRVKEELFSLQTVKEDLRQLVDNPREFMKARNGQVPVWVALVSIIMFMIIGTVVFFVLQPFAGLEIHWLLYILGSPLALISAYFTARAISETGMLAGYISDIIAIPAILFFRTTFQAVTTFMSMLGALQDAAVALLVHLKLGKLTGVRGRDIFKAVFLGMMLGTFVGSLMTYMVYTTYHFGTAEFPAPAAQLFGFLVLSLQGLGHLMLPGMDTPIFPGAPPIVEFLYLLSFGVIGYLVGREVHRRGLSPISLVVGLLIPPATSVTMLFGAFIDYQQKKKSGETVDMYPDRIESAEMQQDKTSRVLSGIVAGEAIVTVVWVIWNVIMLML